MKKVRKTLNQREYDLYLAIKSFINKNGYSPSYRELLDFNIYKSLSSIMETLNKLYDLDIIEVARDEEGKIKSRTIRIKDRRDIK